MSSALLSLIMDFVVLAALVGTIYFAFRLSRSLDNFRKHRDEMKNLIAELTRNINDAKDAIDALKATGNIAANNMEDVLHDSRRMAEELKMINETSDHLASRLEKLASGASSFASRGAEEEYFDEPQAANTDRGPADTSPEPPSFFIQDRDFNKESDEELVSEAERELLQALQENKRTRKG
ncbi:MAG: hypothetical protein KDI11_01705 [Alphaproteobacteria bacterium]|nr:hypothetical protein [Alphaproteobacteria bacterium]